MLNIAIKAARSAGAIINRASLDLDLLKVNTKSPNDFVTEVDHAAEAVIIDTLLGAYPGHSILAEESGSARGAKDSEFVWIIDPLDGTTNFIHGFPVYAVSIALAFKGQVQQAVVYDPTRNDLFFASRGRGAFLNDKRLRVSKRIRMADALIGTGFPFRKGDDFQRYLKMMEAVMRSCAGMRRPGAAALDLCYVAAGYTDGFFETGLAPGTSRPARCSSPKPAGSSAISPAKRTSSTSARWSPAVPRSMASSCSCWRRIPQSLRPRRPRPADMRH